MNALTDTQDLSITKQVAGDVTTYFVAVDDSLPEFTRLDSNRMRGDVSYTTWFLKLPSNLSLSQTDQGYMIQDESGAPSDLSALYELAITQWGQIA